MLKKIALGGIILASFLLSTDTLAKNTVTIKISCTIPTIVELNSKRGNLQEKKNTSPEEKDTIIQEEEKKKGGKRIIIKTVLLR